DMAEGGVVYWGPKIVRGGLFRGAIGGVEGVMAWQERRFAGRCAMRAEAVRQTGATHLVISDENMIGSLRGALEHTRLYPDAGRRIAAYAHGFERHRVTVAVCVRDYADWWTSAMAFRLSRGGPLPRTDLRECLVTQPRRWRHIVEELARVLPDARIVVWSHEASASAPHRLLEELTGFTTPALDAAPRNLRPTAEALRQVMTDCDIDPAQFNWPEGRFMPFTADETQALDAQYQEDLAWLSAGAGGFADYIDAPSAQTEAQTALGRGRSDDGDHRQLA
ncbi:hypothetical protein A8B78_19260, partial [Jannaschia sp. EhC01]